MAEAVTTGAEKVQRRERIKFSVWDSIMQFSDIGIAAWAVIMYIFLYLPIVVLIIFSFNNQKLNVQWKGFTLKYYDQLFHDTEVITAFVNSIEIAVLSTIIAVVIATLGAFSLERFEYRTKTFWDGLNYTKIIIAEIVAGVSTLLFFVQLNNWLVNQVGWNFFGIFSLGFGTVLIAHVAWNVPFAIVVIRARLKGFDRAIEEAGADLFAKPATVFFRITLPVIAPGILAASLLCFTLSFDDFVTTFFTTGPTFNTLPLVVWSKVRMGISPEINAISTFMMLMSGIIIVVLELKARVSKDII